MSLRQLRRVRGNELNGLPTSGEGSSKEDREDGSDNDDDGDHVVATSSLSRFIFDDDDDEDEDDDDDDEEEEEEEEEEEDEEEEKKNDESSGDYCRNEKTSKVLKPVAVAVIEGNASVGQERRRDTQINKAEKGRRMQQDKEEEEAEAADAFLNELIAENQRKADVANADDGSNVLAGTTSGMFKSDPKVLDVEVYMRTNLGGGLGAGGVIDAPVAGRRAGHNTARPRHVRGTTTGRTKQFFTWGPAMSPEWRPAPSFIGGGLGMRRDSERGIFSFEFSPELRAKDRQYEQVRDLGDANLLVMFLADTPHHILALLQLLKLFLMAGAKEQGMQLVKRIIWLYEANSMDAFRPHTGQCRLNSSVASSSREAHEGDNDQDPGDGHALRPADVDANRLFLKALCVHLQLTSELRLAIPAASMGLAILSLDPEKDPCHMWPRLVSLLMIAGMHATLQDIYFGDVGTVPGSPHRQLGAWALGAALSLRMVGDVRTNKSEHVYALESDTPDGRLDASVLLTEAVIAHPCTARCILREHGIMSYPSCLDSAWSIASPACRRMAEEYTNQSHAQWGQDTHMSWLRNIAAAAAGGGGGGAPPSSPPPQYKDSVESEFYENMVPCLPPGALDPQLLEMHYLNGRMRVNPRHLREALDQHTDFRGNVTDHMEAMRARTAARGIPVDLDAPLMQLFWQTLLPWNIVDGPDNPER